MSITTYRRVECDRCGLESDPMRSSFEAREIAKRRGWTRRAGRDLCANCSGAAALAEEPQR